MATMTRREMERLLDLLARMSEQEWADEEDRNAIAGLRHRLWGRVEEVE